MTTIQEDVIESKTVGDLEFRLGRTRRPNGKIGKYAVTVLRDGIVESHAEYKYLASARPVFDALRFGFSKS